MVRKYPFTRFLVCWIALAILTLAAAPGSTRPASADSFAGADSLAGAEFPALPPVSSPAPPGPAAPLSASFTLTDYSWSKTWGGSAGSSMAKSVAVDSSGNLFVAGEFSGTVNFDPAGPNPSATVSSYNGTVDAYLARFNASGQLQWVKTWGAGFTNGACPNVTMGCGRDAANGVAVDSSGRAYVVGLFQNTVDFGNGFSATSNAPNGSNNIYVVRISADGATQWLRAWGGLTGGEAYTVAIDNTRGFVYIEGDWSTSPTDGWVDFNPGGANGLRQNHGFYDAFLSKYSLDGAFQWVLTWGGSMYDDGPGVAIDDSGSLYVCGMYGSNDINFDPADGPGGLGHENPDNSNNLMDVFLVKFNTAGIFQWVRTWGGAGVEDSGAIAAVDHAGNVYATGRFGCTNCNFNVGASGPALPKDLHSAQGPFDAFISKFDANGTFLWSRTWGGSQIDIADALAVDDANDVYVGALLNGATEPLLGRIVTADAGFSKFSARGAARWSKTWGGSGADEVWGLAVDGTRNVFLAGSFQSTVDFNPGDATDNHTSAGTQSAFLTRYTATIIPVAAVIYLPMITR